ncbi:hypothetical protein F9B74_04670 [Pelistega sp. NLN82]|uniref:Uncharacterized protein n=1 Tax=Pelistega ratti TaxID=2652177 RepID=A0A6L9Y568_9BURK|nr:hypothetical protein [Pelistega ratti]NEN75622.1 hypothetical protein [Pelistega ratti]
MYAALQQAWTQEIVLSDSAVTYRIKALMVFLAGFSLLGWTYALISLGLFCAYNRLKYSAQDNHLLMISPSYCSLNTPNGVIRGTMADVSKGFCWIQFTIQTTQHYPSSKQTFSGQYQRKPILLWQWQIPSEAWRRLCVLIYAYKVN